VEVSDTFRLLSYVFSIDLCIFPAALRIDCFCLCCHAIFMSYFFYVTFFYRLSDTQAKFTPLLPKPFPNVASDGFNTKVAMHEKFK